MSVSATAGRILRDSSLGNHRWSLSAHSFTYRADGHVLRHDIGDMAVLAISAADLVAGSNNTGPYRSCGSLRNGLPVEGRFTLRRQLLIHLVDDPLYATRIDVATEFGMDASGMHGRRVHTTLMVPLVESNTEEVRILNLNSSPEIEVPKSRQGRQG